MSNDERHPSHAAVFKQRLRFASIKLRKAGEIPAWQRASSAQSLLWPPDAKNRLFGKDPDAGKD